MNALLASYREAFNNFCIRQGLGRREDIEEYPNVPAAPVYAHTSKLANELIKSARQQFPMLLPIHFDFVSEGSVNAWAFRVDDTYFIGLTSGAMAMLHLVLDRMLASPSTFPNVGEPSEEQANLPPVPWRLPDAKQLFEKGIRPILPKNQKRRIYSKHLADQAILFLVGHEIAHITRGHVDYLHSQSAFLAEAGWRGTAEGRLERQAIEVDADQRSLFARCFSAHQTSAFNQRNTPPWATAPQSNEQWQFDWTFAVNTLFRLFGDPRFLGTDIDQQPYPPLPLRRRIAIDTTVGMLVTAWGAEQKVNAEQLLTSAVKATEDAYAAVGADSPDGGLEETGSEVAREHIERIVDRWDKLVPELKQYSYESLDET